VTRSDGARFDGRRSPGPRRSALGALGAAAAVGVLLARFVLAGSDSPSPTAAPRPAAGSAAAVGDLEARVRQAPRDPDLLTRLGIAYLQRARGTADPGYLARAGEALGRSGAIESERAETLTGLGLLALARHDFAAALDLGRRAERLDPASPEPLGVIVDALVELGRYDEAAATAQVMVDRRPSLASLSRVSYLRELHGDPAGAVTAMTQASLAGSGSTLDVAAVEALLGDLHLGRGDATRAHAAYSRALSAVDGFAAAEVGLARVAAARGDLEASAAHLEPVVGRQPQPAWVALLGDVYAASGRPADAATHYELVRHLEALNRASGMDVDLELARFEADHARDAGSDAEAAVAMARSAAAARPTIFASDTLGWALRQAGQPQEALAHARDAVRLGTADGTLWYHLAVVEADLGLVEDARVHLARALEVSPFLTVRDLPVARALAAELGLALARPPGP